MMSSQGWSYCHVENDNDYNIMYLTFYRLHEVKWVEFCPWNVTDVAGLLFEYAQLSFQVLLLEVPKLQSSHTFFLILILNKVAVDRFAKGVDVYV